MAIIKLKSLFCLTDTNLIHIAVVYTYLVIKTIHRLNKYGLWNAL